MTNLDIMYKKAFRTLPIVLVLAFSTSLRAQGVVPEAWKWAHNLGSSLVNTAYFAALNSNGQNANMTEWNIDKRTAVNIAWASVVYGITNYYESAYLPEREKDLTPADIEKIKGWINFIGSTSPMITLNSNTTMVEVRYNETKNAVAGYVPDETASTVLGGSLFLLRNVGFFYIIPPILKPINFMFFKILPTAKDISGTLNFKTPSRILGCLVFSATSLVYQELLISIKHLANQFFPQPYSLTVLRFDDCTRCWFGTNLFGKSGPIGSHLYRWRQDFVGWASEWIREPIAGIPDDKDL